MSGPDQELLESSDLQLRLKKEEEAAREYKAIFESCQMGIVVVDGERRVLRINQRMLEMYGYESADEVLGKHVEMGHENRKACEEFGQRHFQTLREGKNLHIQFQARRKDGSLFWCRVSGCAIDTEYPRDLSKGVVWIEDDITDMVEIQQRLEYLARFDSLTGMAKRSYFYDRAGEEISRSKRYGNLLSLLMIDIDHFKSVNDTYGHIAGDAVLTKVCDRIRAHIRNSDIPARLGGEEFAVLLPETGLKQGTVLAERLRTAVEKEPIAVGTNSITLTISIGLAELTGSIDDVSGLIHCADQALYSAKDKGRNRVEIAPAL